MDIVQCGLCSKSCLNQIKIKKCNHIYCSSCLLHYLSKRKFCPICVPFKAIKRKRKNFLIKYFLTYLHPVKLIKKIKKHNKKIKSKHLIQITRNLINQKDDEIQNLNGIQIDNAIILKNRHIKKSNYVPITVEKQINPTNATNLNNELNENRDLNNNESNEFDKYERIRELIVKNENLKMFLEKINKLKDTMSSFHKLNEFQKCILRLSQNEEELKKETILLQHDLKELSILNEKLNELIKIRNQQELLFNKANSINEKYKYLADEFREQNFELKESYEKLIENLTKNLAKI